MNKKMIIGLALAVVLMSGSTFSARADVARDRDCAGNLVTPAYEIGVGFGG
jgi:hypothetical protein